MQILKTDEYPTRYVAFDNPGKWVEHTRPEHRGGFEFAVYHLSIPNVHHTGINDGIHIQVNSYQGHKLVLDCRLTVPDAMRAQRGITRDVLSLPQAEILARDWLAEIWPLIRTFIPDHPHP
jgi:hypothetical protein